MRLRSMAGGLLWLFGGILIAGGQSDDLHWIKYPSPGSEGPLHQRQLTSENVTSWLATNDVNQYVLRLDDGALMPASLVGDKERAWQQWFGRKYPEVAKFRDDGDYVDKDALFATENGYEIPADGLFHVAHCIALLRRYIDSTNAKSHVCPRDTNSFHAEHCLEALEEFAFNDGVPLPYNHRWSTDVCFT
ncbi:hypothetical protein M409DRAFT_54167 [Zasmidium cellare ATCC 36951]|uniref:Uncharacterized protein n=1 Tax=Zasmidium cellare ATCC 36951 TaxID=1080233 RepID=A0A6A6CK93_ZASCE|nr:uncharacterized protein M409DRAFT_54167 [Zasmidium cellare ATCC 36951]KAF2167575.1 hypothetical protein M409DRAFT_54167 [Zasmidium cellare ATCC 36951]